MDVDYSRHIVFLLTPELPVGKNKIYLQSLNTNICWYLDFTKQVDFQSLEVVDRGSETQLQVTENLNWIAQWSEG